mgnify:FL=1
MKNATLKNVMPESPASRHDHLSSRHPVEIGLWMTAMARAGGAACRIHEDLVERCVRLWSVRARA